MTIAEAEEILRSRWKRPFRISVSIETGEFPDYSDSTKFNMDVRRYWYSINASGLTKGTAPTGHGENLQKAVMAFLDSIPQEPEEALDEKPGKNK